MKKILTNRHFQLCAGLVLADIIVFTSINPSSASAPWLIIGYLLLGVTFFGFANLFASGLRGYGKGPYVVGKRFLRYSAATCMALIGLQSIGQLTVKDVVALVPLAVLAYLYFGYGKRFQAGST